MDTKRELLTQLKEVEAKTRRVPASMAMDSNYKRLKYIRYADDFLIGVIGSKADCAKMKENFTIFMRDKLNSPKKRPLSQMRRIQQSFLGMKSLSENPKP